MTNYPEHQPKVHLYEDQSAYRHGPKNDRRYADTLCKYNGKAKKITRVSAKVTCKTCLKKMGDREDRRPPKRTRFRIHRRWFRKPLVVLQVEIVEDRAAHCPAQGIEFYEVRFWRDVRPEDIINGDITC